MSREPRYIDRRLFLTGSAIAVLAAACGSNGGASNPLSGATATTAPPPPATIPPATTTPPTTAKPTAPAECLPTGPTTAARVALTFHTDGDLGLVDQLLDVLRARKAPITAFVVGQ